MAAEYVAGHAPAAKAGGMRVAGHAPHDNKAVTKTDEATAKTQVEKALSTNAVGPVMGAAGPGKLIAVESGAALVLQGDPSTKATPSTYTPPEPKHTKVATGKKAQKKAAVGKVANVQPSAFANH